MRTLKVISGLVFWIGLMMIGISGTENEFLKSLNNPYILAVAFPAFIILVIMIQVKYHNEIPETVKRCNEKAQVWYLFRIF